MSVRSVAGRSGHPRRASTRAGIGPIRSILERLPLIGRTADLAELRSGHERALAGGFAGTLITGPSGVGKSRLLAALGEEASVRGEAIQCRAYPIGSSVPYSLFADGFVPLLNGMDSPTLSVLARGHQGRLSHLFPAVENGATASTPADKTQLFWTFGEFLRAWSARQPVVVLLDDLHWADAASLELFHFLCRQLSDEPVAFLGTINDDERGAHPTLRTVLRSLESLSLIDEQPLAPLSAEGVASLVHHVFNVDESVTGRFSSTLYGWTRGNPFFLRETLSELVDSGRLRQEGGSWIGWEVETPELPRSIREAIDLQLERLSDAARSVADVVAVIGTGAELRTLRAVSDLAEPALVRAVEELRMAGVLSEHGPPDRPEYDFRHPMLRQVLEERIGLARRQLLHETVASALEAQYGEDASAHAEELAHHWVRASQGDPSVDAVRYLSIAGERALARFADREADLFLSAALEQFERLHPDERGTLGGAAGLAWLLRRLASARQHRGNYADAAALRERAYGEHVAGGDDLGAANVMRRIGLAHFWAGRQDDALAAFGKALAHATTARDGAVLASVRLAVGGCLQALGRVAEARQELEAALDTALEAGAEDVEARVRRALLIFHTMSGPPDLAREHGTRALEISEARADALSICKCHWALGVLEGLTGHARVCAEHVARGTRLADEMNSPLLRLALDEVAIEWAFSSGDWDTGVALGERAIALARTLNQRRLLPRLLVWTALIYLGRHDTERAKAYLDEAWLLAGADDPTSAPDVHSLIAVHTGMANYHRTLWQWDEAIAVGRRGLAIADRVGFTAWAVHRLLPTIIEAHLYKHDAEGAEPERLRLRTDAEALGHALGLAWTETGDALVEWLRGDLRAAADMLRASAERLESVPFVWDAARVRRQLAARLIDLGERDEAIAELRAVHDVFARLGARFELDKTREMLREQGARPPTRTAGRSGGALTGRETLIVRLVARGASNKAIAKELGISPRTVTTHLSNVYRKLDIAGRNELAALAPVVLASGEGPIDQPGT